jgi:hypothetical protein
MRGGLIMLCALLGLAGCREEPPDALGVEREHGHPADVPTPPLADDPSTPADPQYQRSEPRPLESRPDQAPTSGSPLPPTTPPEKTVPLELPRPEPPEKMPTPTAPVDVPAPELPKPGWPNPSG